MSSPILQVRDLQVNYDRLTAVRNVSLTVHRGEFVAILGPNGAGKSTTLLCIAGAIAPKTGCVLFDGRRISGLPPEKIVSGGLSLVPEGRNIFSRLSVHENLLVGSFARKDARGVRHDIERVLELFPVLKRRYGAPAGQLSGGEQQQLAIARAMMTSPKMMLVDEPSLGLAPMIVEHVYKILDTLRESGVTLIVVEQNLERALRAADRLLVMRDGAIQLSGATEDLRLGGDLEEAYFGFKRSVEAESAASATSRHRRP